MFLKTLELFGFKSFADRTKIEFADGITSLLGPNGCGKSNIVDAIKWVLGEQGVKSLRAEKRDDVIFTGTDHRKPMQMAEVILVMDNESHFLNIDFPEIEIKRRLFRDGTSEYYINRQQVLLKNIKDLFMDTGVGKTAYSILEQGKIDQILSNKPEERRYVFEEAAGISRYKAQSIEAQKKLERTDENIEQVNAIFQEVKRTYESRKTQVAKLQECKELRKRKESTEIELQLSTLQSYKRLQDDTRQKLDSKKREAQELESALAGRRQETREQEEAINAIRDKKSEVSMEIGRLHEEQRGKEASLGIYDKQYWECRQRLENAQARMNKFKDNLDEQESRFEQLESRMNDSDARIAELENAIILINDSMLKAQEDSRLCKQQMEERQEEVIRLNNGRLEITSAISALASEITNELQKLIEDSGYSIVLRQKTEKSVVDNLTLMSKTLKENGRTILKLFMASPEQHRQKLEELYLQIIEYADETKGLFQEFCGSIPTFIDEMIKPDGIISQKKVLDKQLEASQKKEQELLSSIELLSRQLEHHAHQIEELRTQVSDKTADLSSEKSSRQGLQSLHDQIKAQFDQKKNDYDEAVQLVDEEESRLNETLESLNETKADIEEIKERISQMRNELSDINAQLDSENQKLIEKNGDVSALFSKLNEMNNDILLMDSKVTGLGDMLDKIYSDFFDQYGKSLKEFDDHEVTADVNQLKSDLAECKRKLADIPYVNEMAEQEFEEVKARYDLYSANLADLEKAKADLEQVYLQIKTESEQLFMETFTKISASFKVLFTRIFAGGRAELNLIDPDNPLESGIDILAQPPGKKLTYLPLLSGGERSMTAVALLFATYAVKPSPFCILDEIDAALDARNISYFLSVLDDFADKSQFIIITHNKNTVMGSKTLLGVTQQERGVSTMINYKIENQESADGMNLK